MPTRTAARPQGQPLKSPLAAPGAYLNAQTDPWPHGQNGPAATAQADLRSRRASTEHH
jgi:hypothetical protein